MALSTLSKSVERQRQWDTSEGWKTREWEGSASSWTEGRVTRERSRRDAIISRQTRGRRGADRADQILCTTSQIGYAAQVHPRKYTSEEKIRIVLEGFRREVTVSDLCRREGIKPHSYYSWPKEFMEAGKERLARDSVRDATRQEIHALKRENGELKQLVAELSLEAFRLKKTAMPMMEDGAGTSA